jgi:hypothetical protein
MEHRPDRLEDSAVFLMYPSHEINRREIVDIAGIRINLLSDQVFHV